MIIASGQPGRPTIWHNINLSPKERRQLYGHATCSPRRPFVAGEWVSLEFTFTIGKTELGPGGQLALAWSWPLDWTDLQFEDPGGDGFTTVVTRPTHGRAPVAEIGLRYFRQGPFDPWQHHLELTVGRGQLAEGDKVILTCGNRAYGGRGWRVPTFRLRNLEFMVLIDPDRSDSWHRLPPVEGLSIVPGPPERLVVIAPDHGLVGETRTLTIRAEDRWGNASMPVHARPKVRELCEEPAGPLLELGEAVVCADPPVVHVPVRYKASGLTRLEVHLPDSDLSTQSNPVRIATEPPKWRRFWGDMHSGQSEVGCGVGSMAEHFTYARDAAGLQFITHQGNDHYVSRDLWDLTRTETENFHEPGRFITFLGCEWSAPTSDGGDRNVFYRHDEPRLRRSGRFFQEDEPDPEPDLTTAEPFLEAMRHEPVLINMHVGGRPTNLDWHAPEIERLAEIHSTHGTSEWFIKDALRRGYRVGITAGTDGITGRPGACHPGWRNNRNVRNGLTAVYAEELTRTGIWEALSARRCYATSGERIGLWFEVDGQPMGSLLTTAGDPLATIEVEGTAPLESIELLRDDRQICQWQLAGPSPAANERHRIRLLWQGTAQRGTARAQRVNWDGSLHLDRGMLHAVEAVNFHGGEDRVDQPSGDRVAWRNATAGNRAGLVLEIEGDEHTMCSFNAPPIRFSFPLAHVLKAPLVRETEGLDCRVAIGPAPDNDAPTRASLTFRDVDAPTGAQSYWVRVTQVDQAQAWSSPVYMSRI
ncbi:MAG: DUF3604 domain-containing protein [Caldilineaceae bacterium SB0665_bin_21]|nr:DUF3604 domain-containing protein [Caldilineaceae bacterium SB0665_bin_21]